MGRFARSLELGKASWSVLRSDAELTLVPVVSFATSAVVAAALGGAAWFTLDTTTASPGQDSLSPTPLTYVVGFVAYLVLTFVVTFFTGALVSGALQRFRGQDPTWAPRWAGRRPGSSPCCGGRRWWTLGFVLQALEDRAGPLGTLLLRGIGLAWRVVTWLAVPVIIDQGTGPWTSLKTSASLFKQTWGKNLIAQAGLGLLSMLVMLPGIAVGIAVTVAIPLVGIPLLVLWVVGVAVVSSALNGILRTAVYLYASGQQVPGFEAEALAATFGPRRRGRATT